MCEPIMHLPVVDGKRVFKRAPVATPEQSPNNSPRSNGQSPRKVDQVPNLIAGLPQLPIINEQLPRLPQPVNNLPVRRPAPKAKPVKKVVRRASTSESDSGSVEDDEELDYSESESSEEAPRMNRNEWLQHRDNIPIVPIVANIQNIQNVPNLVTDHEKTEFFWKQIASFNWRNKSDGVPDRDIKQKIAILNPQHLKIFGEYYANYYLLLEAQLVAEGMFERCGIVTASQQSTIISHAIAVGNDQYHTLASDPEIFQFLIEMGECQSLDELLPVEMQH